MTERWAERASGDAYETSPPRRAAGWIVAAIVLAAVVIVIVSAIRTSSARIAASTSGTAVVGAATIELADGDSERLLLDADDLYPGRVVGGCLEIDYRGSVPVDLRLHAEFTGGSGLDRYVELALDRVPSSRCGAGAVGERAVIWAGRLSALRERSSYPDGLNLTPHPVEDGDRLAVEISARVVDDDRAQGRDTEFSFTIEARPS